MKKILQIGSITMASYLFALPILFVVHNLTHHHSSEHHCFETTSSENEVHDFDDCNICDLFLNQQLFNQKNAQLFKAEPIVEKWIIEEITTNSFSLINVSARGPPIC